MVFYIKRGTYVRKLILLHERVVNWELKKHKYIIIDDVNKFPHVESILEEIRRYTEVKQKDKSEKDLILVTSTLIDEYNKSWKKYK